MKSVVIFFVIMLFLASGTNAQVGINNDNSTPNSAAMLDVKSNSRGFLPPRMTHSEIDAISNPPNGLIVYCTDCGQEGNGAFFGYINGVWVALNYCVPPSQPGTGIPAATDNQITWNWSGVTGATGYKWNSLNDYSTAMDMGNSLTKTETGLICNTAYTRYVWSYNSCGSSSSHALTATTLNGQTPVLVTITCSANPVCQGTIVTFTATVQNGGSNPVFVWHVNGMPVGSNSPSMSYAPFNGDVITCTVASSVNCVINNPVTSNPITMVVNPILLLSATITASANNVCSGTMVNFNCIPGNAGSSPVYQWKVNNMPVGGNSSTFSYIPSNTDQVKCMVTSNATCLDKNTVTSNIITMTVLPLVSVAISISGSQNPVCSGTPVTFTAIPVNGGTNPSYQWKVNGNPVGINQPTFIFNPMNTDTVTCSLASSISCPSSPSVTSAPVVMSVVNTVVVSVGIVSSANPVCRGTQITFTSTVVNGGSSPFFNWYVNNVLQPEHGPEIVRTPDSFFDVFCEVVSSTTCVTGNPAASNVISQVVNPILTLTNSINVPATTNCAGTVVTATCTQNYPVSSCDWYLNGTIVSYDMNFTFTPVNNDQLYCACWTTTGGCWSAPSATSNILTFTTIPVQAVSVSAWPKDWAVVSGTPDTYYAKVVNGGANPTYNWYMNNTLVYSGSSSYTYVPSNNQNIKCIVTSGLQGCLTNNPATSNTINTIVYTTGVPCTGIPTVVHGGRTYNSVQIGTQCWLRENMNTGTMIDVANSQTNNGIVEKYCYQNDTLNCNIYGGLYQWAEMVQYLNGVTNQTHWNPLPTGNVQGICPVGWHLPTLAESETLTGFLGSSTAGGKMKETGLVHWNAPNIGALNSVGFTALPSGDAWQGTFNNLRSYTNMWTITKGVVDSSADSFGAAYNFSAALNNQAEKVSGYSVRCIKD